MLTYEEPNSKSIENMENIPKIEIVCKQNEDQNATAATNIN